MCRSKFIKDQTRKGLDPYKISLAERWARRDEQKDNEPDLFRPENEEIFEKPTTLEDINKMLRKGTL